MLRILLQHMQGKPAQPSRPQCPQRQGTIRLHLQHQFAPARKVAALFGLANWAIVLNLVPGMRYVDEKGQTVIGSVRELQGLTRRARAELAAAEKALEDLHDEARRAGVPPGWLR